MIKKVFNSLLKLFLTLISYLPFPVLYFLSNGLSFVIYRIFRYRVKVVRKNLLNSFPEKNSDERLLIEKKFYNHLADMIIETIKMISITPYSLHKRMLLNNPEIIDNFYKKQQSIVFITNHYNNWEYAGIAVSNVSRLKIYPIYKPLNNLFFNDFIKEVRSRFGAIPIAKSETLRTLVANKFHLTGTAFIADQTPIKNEIQYWTTFLNQDTPVYLGVEKIAIKFNYPVVYGHVQKVSRGKYELTFKVISEKPSTTLPYQITEMHIRELENAIIKNPEFWLWSHNRWKHSKPLIIEPKNAE